MLEEPKTPNGGHASRQLAGQELAKGGMRARRRNFWQA